MQLGVRSTLSSTVGDDGLSGAAATATIGDAELMSREGARLTRLRERNGTWAAKTRGYSATVVGGVENV